MAIRLTACIADIFAQCGRETDAQAIWKQLSDAGKSRSTAETLYVYQSARRSCGGASGDGCRADIDLEWMARLQQALQSVIQRMENDDSPSGLLQCAAGQLLTGLGRTDEARTRFRAALLAPDHLLSHHIARTG